MDRVLQLGFGIALSYAIGSCVAGYYLTRWRIGKDLREMGSGSAGARNTARVLGRTFGVVAFAWDFAKGALAVLLSTHLFSDDIAPGAAALAVTLGHIWPAQLGFRGGKGVAPVAGALVVLQPWVLAAVAIVYISGAIVTRCVARRALAAFASGVAAVPFLGVGAYDSTVCAVLLAILIWTHREGFLPQEVINTEATK